MKNQRIFPGIILIGFGAYLLLKQSGITILEPYFSWPTLLMIVGIAFLGQGYTARDHEAILPGVILMGFGLHFHLVNRFVYWPNDTIGMLVLFIAIGYFLRYQKIRSGLFQAFLFFLFAILLLFYDKIANYLGFLQNGVSLAWKFWPVIIILFGVYFLSRRKK